MAEQRKRDMGSNPIVGICSYPRLAQCGRALERESRDADRDRY